MASRGPLTTSRKHILEKALIEKRNQHYERQKKVQSADSYHRDLNLLSSFHNKFRGKQTRKSSKIHEESRVIEAAKFERKEKLLQRREKLAKLLAKEGEIYLVEMKTLENIAQKNDPWNIARLKEQIDNLRKQREEAEEELRRKNYYHLFQETNIPYLKEHKIRLSEEEMKQAMELRKNELEEQTLRRKTEEQKQLTDLENFREEKWKELQSLKQEKHEQGLSYITIGEEKMRTYETNKFQLKALNNELQFISKYQNVIDGVRKKRQKVQEIQEIKKEKISQLRPSKEKVRKMCVEIRHGLELDSATLNYLSQLEIRQREIADVQINMDKLIADIGKVQQKIDTEDKHIEQLQSMFEEEATSCWDKWKNGWNELVTDQDKLMDEVFEDLVDQLERVITKINECSHHLETTNSELISLIKKHRDEYDKKSQLFQNQEDHLLKTLNEAEQRLQRIMNEQKKKMYRDS